MNQGAVADHASASGLLRSSGCGTPLSSRDHVSQLGQQQSYGEGLMKLMLDQLVPKKFAHWENFWPPWLKNPKTGSSLELDRYYEYGKKKFAFEFQGEHHFLDKLQIDRDKIKKKICDRRSVKLVFVTARDLTWRTMYAKVGWATGRCKRPKCTDNDISQMANEYRDRLRMLGCRSADLTAAKLLGSDSPYRQRKFKKETARMRREIATYYRGLRDRCSYIA